MPLTAAEQRGYERGRAEAVPDGWKIIPSELFEMLAKFWHGGELSKDDEYKVRDLLDAALIDKPVEGK